MRRDIHQIGMTYKALTRSGIHDIKAIATEYYEQQRHLDRQQRWSHDRYLKESSDARAEVRSLSDMEFKDCSIWSINHYLGLNRHPYVIAKAKEAIELYGTGCGTSAMSGGHCQLHKNLQIRFAKILSKEECLLFPTGFTANTGAIAALGKGTETLIIIDRDSHASIIDGCRASGSKYIPFKHNCVQDLESKLKNYSGEYTNLLVVVESAYSMEGDIAPLRNIFKLKEKYDFLLYVDEAHTFGFYGKNSSGLCSELGIAQSADFIMTTLSKSTASIGGIVATSKEFASYLRWSTSYIFQASIPPTDVAVADACLDLMHNQPAIMQSLWEKTAYLRKQLIDLGFDVGESESPIVPVFIRDSDILKKMEEELYDQGIFTIAIQYPVVKESEVRFRFIVNNSHTFDDINHLIQTLCDLGCKYKLITPHWYKEHHAYA